MKKYLIREGIPIFIPERDLESFDVKKYDPNVDLKKFIPLLDHPYYTQFTQNWKIILDVGCGDGVMSARSSDISKEIFCVDISFKSLSILRNMPNMYPICANCFMLSFPDNFFDGVLCIFLIEHIESPLLLLKELHRVLKQNEELVIATDTKIYDIFSKNLINIYKNRKLQWMKNCPTHINLM